MVSESDLNLLEAYLDDTLSVEQVQRLDDRLSEEADLLAAMDVLRMDRAARVAAFQSLAPDETQADQFAKALVLSVQRNDRHRQLRKYSGIAAAVAACLIVGFSVGWFGRGREAINTPRPISVAPAPAAQPHADTHLALHPLKAADAGLYQVALLDKDGKVIAVQKFSRIEEARQFATDLGQYEARRQQVQDSQAMLVTDQF